VLTGAAASSLIPPRLRPPLPRRSRCSCWATPTSGTSTGTTRCEGGGGRRARSARLIRIHPSRPRRARRSNPTSTPHRPTPLPPPRLTPRQGVDWVFVDHPSFKRPNPYADEKGPYPDNQMRFTLLTLAACEAPLNLSLAPGGKGKDKTLYGQVRDGPARSGLVFETGGRGGEAVCGIAEERPIHRPPAARRRHPAHHHLVTPLPPKQDVTFLANDWHASLVPVYLAGKYRPHGVYTNARSILAIHNLRHQGVYPPHTFKDLGLPKHWYGAVEYQYPPHQVGWLVGWFIGRLVGC
jgi:hypothetical protein